MSKFGEFIKQKKVIITGSIILSALVLGALGAFIGVSTHNKKQEDENNKIYNLGVKQLVNREHKKAFSTFKKITGYKDSVKKQDYAYQLNRIDEHDYAYESIIDEIVRYKGKSIVMFNTNGGVEIAPKTITEKKEIYITEVASKSFEDFAGWNLSFGQYDKENDSVILKLNAQYTHHEYSIGYVLDGGELPGDAPLHFTYYSKDIHLPAPSKKGYDFTGYIENTGDTPEVDFVIPNHTHRNVTVEAIYDTSTIHVNFDANGGTCSETEGDYKYLSSVALPIPTKDHYSFGGWYYKGELVSEEKFNVCDDNATLVASYLPNEYSITYHNVPSDILANLPTSFNYDSPDINLPFPCKSGYVFIGWQEYAGGPFVVSYKIPQHTDHNIEIWAEYVLYNMIPYTGVVTDILDLKGTGLQDKVTDVVFAKNVSLIQSNVFDECLNKVDNIYFEEGCILENVNNSIIRHNNDGSREFIHVIPKPFAGEDTIELPSVNKIYDKAFKDSEIKHVVSSNILEEIGLNAFENSSVEDITGSDIKVIKDYAFKNCANLDNSLFIGNPNITEIGANSFYGCSSLTDVSFSGKLKTIKEKAFENCTSLDTVRLEHEKGASIANNAFTGCVNVTNLYARMNNIEHVLSLIPNAKDSLENIHLSGTGSLPSGLFNEYSKLITVEFAEEVTFSTIGENTFSSTSKFEEIAIPASVTRIEANAFKDSSLKNLSFDDSKNMKYIGASAFENSGVTSVDLHDSRNLEIENDAFKNCKDLTEISLFYDALDLMKDAFTGCTRINRIDIYFPETDATSYTLPDNFFSDISSVTRINLIYLGEETKTFNISVGLFSGCTSLVDFKFTNFELGELGDYAFENCISFTNLSLDHEDYLSNLEYYPRGLFYGCNKLHISLQGTREIDSYAFASCNNLGNLYISKSVEIIGSEAFAYVSGGSTILDIEYTAAELADKLLDDGDWYEWNKNCFCLINYGVTH